AQTVCCCACSFLLELLIFPPVPRSTRRRAEATPAAETRCPVVPPVYDNPTANVRPEGSVATRPRTWPGARHLSPRPLALLHFRRSKTYARRQGGHQGLVPQEVGAKKRDGRALPPVRQKMTGTTPPRRAGHAIPGPVSGAPCVAPATHGALLRVMPWAGRP